MADEVQVQGSLFIKKGNLEYRSYPNAFKADLEGDGAGPTPGMVTVPVTGVSYDLSELTTPGWCIMRNVDDTNAVHWGTYASSLFVPIGELMPGDFCIFRFSHFFGTVLEATGTGTVAGTEALHMIAENAPCKVLVEAFEA